MAKTATTGFTEAFVHTDPFYRGTYKATLRRSASGSGVSDAVVTRTNLVTNPSFEVDLSTWSTSGTVARTTAQFYSGVASASLTYAGSGTVLIQQSTRSSVTTGLAYTASFYLKQSVDAGSVICNFMWYNAAGSLILDDSHQTNNPNTAWQRFSQTRTAPANAASCSFRVYQTAGEGGGAVSTVNYVDAVLIEQELSTLSYFDGTYVNAYNGYTLTSKSWSGTADASTSTATFRPTVAHKVTQLRLGALTDFSFPYRFGGRFYLGFARIQKTATGTGQGAESALRLIKRFRTATGSGLGTQTAARLIKRFRTATGSGTGTQTAARLIKRYRSATGLGQGTENADRLVSRYRTATGSGLGTETVVYSLIPTVKREATGSGLGIETVIGVVIKYATAAGSGFGASNNTIRLGLLRTGYGSGGATAGDNATGLLTAYRTASSSGVGASSISQLLTFLRTATGSGTGTSTAILFRTLPRTATGSGSGVSATQQLHRHLRSSTSLGEGSSAVVGARVVRVGSTGSGTGTSSANWVKSHIFRVPYTYNYPGGSFGGGDAANRLGRYNRSGVRARNLYELTNGEYTIVDQRDLGQVVKLWYGGRDYFLNDAEVAELTAAGFGDSIT